MRFYDTASGGQFLRAYAERYNNPPIRNLITFGSQHMGIADMPACKPYDVLCQVARNVARAGVYNEWAQQNLVQVRPPPILLPHARPLISLCISVQAQYFRDPAQLPKYLAANHFLTSINNEVPATRNATYAAHLAQLETLVLVLFERDRTVVPKESAWFGSYAPPPPEDTEGVEEEEEEEKIVPMREQPLYKEDWIGLRALDEHGRVVLESCDSEHMHLSTECWKPLVEKYVGSPRR